MFHVKQVEEVLELIKKEFSNYPKKTKSINVTKAKGYVLASDIVSQEDIPSFHRSTVDGYAVMSKDVMLASHSSPVPLKWIGQSVMGELTQITLQPETCVYVPTGGHIPKGSDAVVMIEQTERMNNDILIQKGVSPFENVFQKGSDIQKNETVIKKNTTITDTVIGVLKAIGVSKVEVYQNLKLTIVSTGDEITDNSVLNPGEVRDINTHTISSFVQDYPIDIMQSVCIKDNEDIYKQTVLKAYEESDLVIASGGSSVGEKDYTIRVLESMDARVLVHGISIRPGKPTIIANVNGKPFIGLPGNPLSSYVVLTVIFQTLWSSLFQQSTCNQKPYIEGVLTKNIFSTQGRRLYQIVSIEEKNSNIEVTPIYSKSGMIKLLASSYGYVVLGENEEGKMPGDKVKVYKWGV